MSELISLPELRLMHELGEREVHMMRRIPEDQRAWIASNEVHADAYYMCKCGALANRYGRILPDVGPSLF